MPSSLARCVLVIMRYLCSQCGHKSESSVALNDAQLHALGCAMCGVVGSIKARPDADSRWWLGIKGERHGPFTVAQLSAMAGEGRITANSYIWGPGFTAWERAGRIPDLAPAFQPAATPPPLPPALPSSRTVARPVTRAGMFATPTGDREVSVSGPMPLPAQGSLIAQLAPRTAAVVGQPPASTSSVSAGALSGASPRPLPATSQPSQQNPIPSSALPPATQPATTGSAPAAQINVRLDDARKPPLTVFGMPLVQPSQAPAPPPAHPAAPKSIAPAMIPDAVAPVAISIQPPAVPPAIPTPAISPAPIPARALPQPAFTAPMAVGTGPVIASAATPKPSLVNISPTPEPVRTSKPTEAVVVPAPAALDDDFFTTAPSETHDIFASMDATSGQGADMGALLRDAPAPMRPRAPTKSEMQALRQEFSVVARLEKHNRKRSLYVGAAASFIAAVVFAILVLAPEKQLEFTGPGTSASGDGYFERPLYEIPTTPTPEVATIVNGNAAVSADGTTSRREGAAGSARKDGSKVGSTARPKNDTPPVDKTETATISAERFAELTRDEVGKTEMKLDFDSYEAARKASSVAEAKKSATADDLAVEVVHVFAKKRTQFARCTDQREEKLRVTFTVSTNGKVSGVNVEGAANDAKRSCVKEILERSVFPSGSEALVYSQVLTL